MKRGNVGWMHKAKALAGDKPSSKFNTGPSFYKRKEFPRIQGHWNRMHLRIGARGDCEGPSKPEHRRYSYLPGDVRDKPKYDMSFDRRVDFAEYAWKKRGKLQLYQIGKGAEIFPCYDCGYPVKSGLVAIKNDNWDWRMCYFCYLKHTQHNTADVA